MMSRLIGFALPFSSYWCLKFVELLEFQKSSVLIFPVLKGLISLPELNFRIGRAEESELQFSVMIPLLKCIVDLKSLQNNA